MPSSSIAKCALLGLVVVLVLSLSSPAGLPRVAAAPLIKGSSTSPESGLTARPALSSGVAGELFSRARAVFDGAGLPEGARLEPNFAYSAVREGSALVPSNLAEPQVTPGPTSIGVNDLGLRVDSAGNYVPYSYRTTSIDGTVSIQNISLLPVMSNASDAITLQLNAVLNNVTIFGQSIYQIWAQNVVFYSVANDQLQLLTDAWNFTGVPFELFQNDIYRNAPGGFLFTGTYVHQVPLHPPAFVVRPPFTIRFYLNSTNLHGRNALFFNYTLQSAYNITLGHQNFGRAIENGSFDWIIFNSTAGMPKGYSAPPASFLISGSQATNLGLPNDAEMAICGPSDGFSAVARSLNATAQLLMLSGTTHTYVAVPAAFTTTEDTGESVEGVDAHFTAPSAREGLAYLSSGPEFVYGLWNATAPGVHERSYTVHLSPSPTLLWVSPDLGGPNAGFNNSSAAWALAPGPDRTFWLPTGPGETYSAAALANDFAPSYFALAPGGHNRASLAPDPRLGVYVPVLAFGNAGVAAIAESGTGSAGDPYVLRFAQPNPISSLFGVFDIFTEPLYPGLLLSGVTAHVTIDAPPNLYLQYAPGATSILEDYGLSVPDWNYLPMEIYDSSNISIVHAPQISGWFPGTLTGFLMASLFLSNDSHTLVAYDRFSSMGSALVIVDPNGNRTREDNTVFGNRFVPNTLVSSPNASSLYVVEAFNTSYTGAPGVGGLGVFSSGNTIYNNEFSTPISAYSPPQNPYLAYVFVNDLGYHDFAAVSATWHNAWNITLSSVTRTRVVNGFSLGGSLVGAPFEGGNVWSNWNGSVPYTDQGLIVAGGDAIPVPLPGGGVYAVVFHEIGLPSGTPWRVTIGGSTYSSTEAWILIYEPATSYPYSVPSEAGYSAHPAHGLVNVNGNVEVVIRFA